MIVRNIEFASTCQDTLMPFHGKCHVAYIPAKGCVLGLSKLARLVNVLSKRLCTQQSLACALVDAVDSCVPCKGVMSYVNARHLAYADQRMGNTASSSSGCFAKDVSDERQVRILEPGKPCTTLSLSIQQLYFFDRTAYYSHLGGTV